MNRCKRVYPLRPFRRAANYNRKLIHLPALITSRPCHKLDTPPHPLLSALYTRFPRGVVGISIGKSLVRRRWERKGILRIERRPEGEPWTLRIELWKRPILQCQLDPSNQSFYLLFFFLDDGVRMVRTMMCEKGRNNRFICFRWDAVSTSLCVCLIFNRMEWSNEGENKNWLGSWGNS